MFSICIFLVLSGGTKVVIEIPSEAVTYSIYVIKSYSHVFFTAACCHVVLMNLKWHKNWCELCELTCCILFTETPRQVVHQLADIHSDRCVYTNHFYYYSNVHSTPGRRERVYSNTNTKESCFTQLFVPKMSLIFL